MGQSSQEKFEDVDKGMVEAEQEEASQGVGQPCPTNCIEERQCIPKGVDDVNIPKNEEKVVEQSNFLSHEVVEDEVSKAMENKDWHDESDMERIPFEEPTIEGMIGKHVGLDMQQVEANCSVLLLSAMLWIHMVLKVALQISLYRLPCFFEEDYAMESSLAGERIIMYGGNASQVGIQACFLYEANIWIQGIEDRCCTKLQERLVFGFTGAQKRLIMHVLWTHGCTQCHIFDPSGVCITLRKARGFPFDQEGSCS
ncbi:hypothetical protein GOP47_0020303 [Adiantum capillus-veneris]|uniref:Uncharacterized protein n=1 Tax=Adiantum capillus-veneris TaxID=13818 RepID=A0A9D4UCQ3_ADICA|nr:hypothetical protein GOP47_0020303 [Adiantum capillus-veneris]